MNDSELFSQDFNVFRCDRSPLNSVKIRGGGVLIAVRKKFDAEVVSVPNIESVEMVIVKISVGRKKIYICCIYIPSNSDLIVYREYMNVLNAFIDNNDVNCSNDIVIIGDFNLPNVVFVPDEENSHVYLPVHISTEIESEVLDNLLSRGVNQMNSVYNFMGRILDLLFCSNSDIVTVHECASPMITMDVYHVPFFVNFEIDFPYDAAGSNEVFYDFKRGDYVGLNVYFSSINWDRLFNGLSVEKDLDLFYDLLSYGIEQFIPTKVCKSNTDPPWYNRELKNLKNIKAKAYKRYMKSKQRTDYTAYSAVRRRFDFLQSTRYQKYLGDTQNNLTNDPSKFWSYVDLKRKTTGFPARMTYKEIVSDENTHPSSLFATFFSEVYTDSPDLPEPNGQNWLPMFNVGSIALSYAEVFRGLFCINTSKGSGPDNVHPLLLSKCAKSLTEPLQFLFNLSLSTGVFPKRWKTSSITPIFKSGSRMNVTNYRGISILPTLGKFFESLVTDILATQLRPIISTSQHGFLKGRSTITNLTEFTHIVSNIIESGLQLDVVYTDFSKAFDKINHTLLLAKLAKLGIHSSLLDWLRSYLSDRQQYVNIHNVRSGTFNVLSGVPQGSHLGPLLFVIFINDIKSVLKNCDCLLYADDLKLYRSIKHSSDAILIQNDLDMLVHWCKNNGLCLNVKKCFCMTYSRKTSPMKFVYSINDVALVRLTEVRDLGVVFDSRLLFERHIEIKIAKAYSMLGFVKRICVDFTNLAALRSIYCAHVRSHLEFASVVWSPHYRSYCDRIESIQKKFIIYALRNLVVRNNFALPPYLERCVRLNLETLERRRVNASIFLMFDLLMGFIDAPNLLSLVDFYAPRRRLRETSLLRPCYHRTDYGRNEPMIRMCNLFNKVDYLFDFCISRCMFRCNVRSSILE